MRPFDVGKHMKPIAIGLALAGIALGAALPAHAAQAWTLKARIPFAFAVNDSTLPAGDYIVTYSHPGVVRFASSDGTRSAAALTLQNGSRSSHADETWRLVFILHGSEYHLSHVWKQGEGHELVQPPVREEKASRRMSSEITTIVLAAVE